MVQDNFIVTFESCIEACTRCIAFCSNRPGMQDCIKMCERCIDACKDCIASSKRSPLDRAIHMQQCIDACYNCAKECEKHDHYACIDCSDECRSCIAECEILLD